MQEKEQKISPIKQRILHYADSLGISKREFYLKIGVSRGTLEAKSGITEDILAKFIATYPSVNPEWLISGKGTMIAEQKISNKSEISIPLIPNEAFAGYGLEQFSDIPIEDYYHITEFDNADFLIRVKGDSMAPKYNGGDIVACKKLKETLFFQWNRIYVVYTNSQGIMIKRVEPAEDADSIELVSDNPAYKPFEIPKSDIASIALVLGAITLE